MIKRPLLIDCDPGVDDTFAILLAASRPEFNIVAVNPVAGNVPLAHTANNARRLAGFLGLGCRVGIGAESPLVRTLQTAAHVHGNNGLGGLEIPAQPVAADAAPAWDVLYEEAKKADGALEVIALGPLTNIATALLLYPDLPPLIRQIVVMGGSAAAGNISAYAEFNIWVDPHACNVVLESGIPLTFCGLDGIETVAMSGEEVHSVASRSGKVKPILDPIASFMAERAAKSGRTGHNLCDLAAMACLIKPGIASYNHCAVACETRSTLSVGQTLVDLYHLFDKKPNVNWITNIDKRAYLALLDEMLAFYA